MNARPRMPKTIEGTAARFWMFSSTKRTHPLVWSANSSR